ncbi:MAG: hypothetical protein KAU20_03495 [Nanoarchaeota archaeon]|nr:hypothetical protein [Nanoarchaeota archaeon]
MSNIFQKVEYEQFGFTADFEDQVTATGETIASKTVTAVDKAGTDATSDIIESSTISGTDVIVVIKDGDDDLTDYIITVRIVTSIGYKWEMKVYMRVKT